MTVNEVQPRIDLLPPSGGQMAIINIGSVQLESGEVLPSVSLAVQRWGELAPNHDNVVLVEHALTGDSYVTGPVTDTQPSPGWWNGMVGPGEPIDTGEWCAIATNVLGGCRGTTGPSSLAEDGKPWGSRFPGISIRDQVNAEKQLFDLLGIDRLASVVGGSMGGMRALEWAVSYPDNLLSALILATGSRATADQIGTQTTQIAAIMSDPDWQGGDYHGTGRSPRAGLRIARRIAHLTYRAEAELDARFENAAEGNENPWNGGRYAVQSYLEHQADKLVERFDPSTYILLTDAVNRHDIGRGRGGVAAALASITVPVVVGGVDSDRAYPLRLQEEMAAGIPKCTGLEVLNSKDGHDGFLTEAGAVAELLRRTMELARSSR
ncbi:homoserine O-acetyltransferase [Rhodococcus sp. OK302]|uniref:homoserine O-acetyltransferase MetX n=1 Tax=Rhodococcus sp. OK302 TaxID=1882769 RepID=UPI000B9EF4B9|nr:homoserine O-acetyltransferase [Rhodococcus sp. OK302]